MFASKQKVLKNENGREWASLLGSYNNSLIVSKGFHFLAV